MQVRVISEYAAALGSRIFLSSQTMPFALGRDQQIRRPTGDRRGKSGEFGMASAPWAPALKLQSLL